MPCMSVFVETDHPRADNGTFAEKPLSAPDIELLPREQAAELHETVQNMARMYASKYAMDAHTRDEIVQDTLVDVLAQHKRGAKHALDGAFLNRATRAVASRHFDPDAHHTTLTGRRLLAQREEAFMAEHGREVSTAERNRMADEVRMSFPAGRRPVVGFQFRNTPLSLDLPVGENGDTTFGDLLPARSDDIDYSEAANEAAAALDALEDQAVTRDEVQRSAWTLIAPDAPQPVPVSRHTATAARKHVKAVGDVAELARKFSRGQSTPEDDAALFAPFQSKEHPLPVEGRDQVARALLKHPAYAGDLWNAALRSSKDPIAEGCWVTQREGTNP